MKNVYIGLLFLLIFPALTYAAQTTVRNQVTVQTNSNSDCKTDVTITTNGEVKTYHSTDCNQNVEIQSDNGSSKVSINSSELPKPTRVISQPVVKEATDTPTLNPTRPTLRLNKSEIRESLIARILKHLEFIRKIRIEIKL